MKKMTKAAQMSANGGSSVDYGKLFKLIWNSYVAVFKELIG